MFGELGVWCFGYAAFGACGKVFSVVDDIISLLFINTIGNINRKARLTCKGKALKFRGKLKHSFGVYALLLTCGVVWLLRLKGLVSGICGALPAASGVCAVLGKDLCGIWDLS